MKFKSILFPQELAIDGIIDSYSNYGDLLNYMVKMKHKKLILDKLEVISACLDAITGVLDEISCSGQDTGNDEDILAIQLVKEIRSLILINED